MPYAVDFNHVSTQGLEASPVAAAIAGLRAHEARYFKNKYDHVFTVEPASYAKGTIDWVHRILKDEPSSRARSQGWPEPFAVPTSPSRPIIERAPVVQPGGRFGQS